jgi:DNA invertase Pin-like site-specific DNA recombinase
MPLVFGYARVSTDGQTLDAQVAQLEAAGAGGGAGAGGSRVFREKVSGAARNRPQLAKLLASLSPGDVVLVTRLDRLARSTRDLLNVLAAVAEKGAAFRSLGDPWADTTTPHGRLMLTVLAGLAEFERELIRSRTSEGRARARANGVKMGPPYKLTPHQRQEARRRREGGESLVSIARSYNVHHATIGRL